MHTKPLGLITAGIACIAAGVIGASRGARPSAAMQQPAPAGSTSFAVTNVRIFDGERLVGTGTVVVRDGLIQSVGTDSAVPAGVQPIDGTGRTLLPGLIDAHTHSWGDAPARALVFGVTTSIDMFTDHAQAAQWRREQANGGAPGRADVVSAGTLVTAPKGHGTQFGIPIPTITSPGEAPAFVDARIAEGSDFIKVVYEEGTAHGLKLPSIDEPTLRAVVSHAKRRGRLAVVHVSTRRAAEMAIAAGADGLVHSFGDEPPPREFAATVRRAGAFVVPTLSVIESVSGTAGGAELAKDASLGPYLTLTERGGLGATFPQRPGAQVRLPHALAVVTALSGAGVALLAGSDAPNPGTSHGVTIHRELELLVRAGLTPVAALKAATAAAADAFKLADRGRIRPGARADLVLVEGDPTRDVLATRRIEAVWKGGHRLDRKPAPMTTVAAASITDGRISDFDDGQASTAFGTAWQVSTDSMMGGSSEARMQIIKPGAAGSAGAMEISGAIQAGAPFPWAGAMFFPSTTPMTPVDLSKFQEIVFSARGDGREYLVMLFATRFGNIPMSRPFVAGPEWKEHAIPLASFSNADGADVKGIMFSAGQAPGPFRLVVDAVRLR